MRPTTILLLLPTIQKTSGKSLKSFENSVLWVPQFSADSIQQFDEFFVARRFVFLPTQDIILKEIASGESNLVWESLFWRKLLCYIEKEKIDWLLLFSTMATDGAAEFMSNYGRSVQLFLFTKFPGIMRTEGGRPAADLLIGNGNTNLRDASYEITKRPRYW